MVRAEIEPILATYGFRRLPDDVDEDNEKAFALFYENATNDEIITIDILRYIELGSSPVIGYFLIRMDAGIYLKQFLYPNIRQEVDDPKLWTGWKCYTETDVQKALKEIAVGAEKYLRELSE